MVGPAARREAVAHLRARFGLSERRACRIAGADRKMVRYQSRRSPDTALRTRLRDLANDRRHQTSVYRAASRQTQPLKHRERKLEGRSDPIAG